MRSKTIQTEVFVGSVHHEGMYKPICTLLHPANVGFPEKSPLVNDRLCFPWVCYQKGCLVPSAGMFVLEGPSLRNATKKKKVVLMFVYEGIFPLMSLEHSWAWK